MSDTIIAAICFGILTLVFGSVVVVDRSYRRTHQEFMTECESARPHYECVALWRGASP